MSPQVHVLPLYSLPEDIRVITMNILLAQKSEEQQELLKSGAKRARSDDEHDDDQVK